MKKIGQAIIKVSTKDMTEQEWIEARKQGIGGSDAAAILGMNPWSTPLTVYLDKMGELPEKEDNESMYWGRELEEVVAKEFAKRHPEFKVQRVNAVLQHPEHEFMTGNIDRLIIDKGKGMGILEIKTTSEYNKDEWLDENIPDNYYIQLQHYLGLTGFKWGYFAVLIGGRHYIEYYVEENPEIIVKIIEAEKNYWNNHIIPKVQPEATESQVDEEALNLLYPVEEPGTVITMDDAKEYLLLLRQAEAAEEEAKAKIEFCKNKLKERIGEYEQAWIGTTKITWKTVITNRVDTKKLKADYPDIYEKCIYKTSNRQFRVGKDKDKQ